MKRVVALSVVVAALPAAPATARNEGSVLQECSRTYRPLEFRAYVKNVYDRPEVKRPARKRIRVMVKCASSPKARRAMKRRLHVEGVERYKRLNPWDYAWSRVDPGLKNRLAVLRYCESTNNYTATNGSHWGAYQYDIATWAQAGGSGRADWASPREQDVRTAWFWPSHQGQWACRA